MNIYTSQLDSILDSVEITQGYATGFFVALVNIQTLDLFKVLDKKITRPKILILLCYFTIGMILNTVVHINYNYDQRLYLVFEINVIVDLLSVLIFDNFMGVYLSLLVFKRIKDMNIEKSKLEKEKYLLIASNLLTVTSGWISTSMFVVIYKLDVDDDSKRDLFYLQFSSMCFHNLLVILMFFKYKTLVLIKKRKKKPNQAEKLNDATVKVS
ncbi:hypothetical protein HK103_005719 [Boothiomyces macroporosus]|uniref:Uncharacterized protein n=1 Tax=Boothiomyces macroporosus TaxID=261099 RepID=A0AAD5UET8_9FUNG|nr:hypothetical protein HK103_005719 [Boothiomyces macroporosus]